MNLAEFLLNLENEYNGHKTTEIKGIPLEAGLQLCKDLEELAHGEYSFVCELWTDGCYTIIQKDYWKQGQHHLGHTDRNILNVAVVGAK